MSQSEECGWTCVVRPLQGRCERKRIEPRSMEGRRMRIGPQVFPFGEPPAVKHSSTSLRLPGVRGKSFFSCAGDFRELFRHYHSVISRSRGISRHVPVDLVGWLDFARHDRMIAVIGFRIAWRGDRAGWTPTAFTLSSHLRLSQSHSYAAQSHSYVAQGHSYASCL